MLNKKHLLLIAVLCCFYISVFSQVLNELVKEKNACIYSYFSQPVEIGKSIYKVKVDSNEYRIIINIDSANYEIVRIVKHNGIPEEISIRNNNTQVAYWQIFYSNGQLMKCGFTASYLTNIGNWLYYKEDGEFDRIVDYEKDSKFSFCDFYQLSNKQGLTRGDFSFKMKTSDAKWVLDNWSLKKQLTYDNGKITVGAIVN